MERSLKLSEKLFCLSVDQKNGGIFLNALSTLMMTLAGSVFIEMMNKGLISIDNEIVHVKDPTVQNDEIHEFFMRRIRIRLQNRKLKNWIYHFNLNGRKIQKYFIRDLVRKNVLRTEERRILFVPYEKIFVADRGLIDSVRGEIENVLLQKSGINDEMYVLAAMVERSNLLSKIVPDRWQRKEARRFLKSLPLTQVAKAVQEAIQMRHSTIFAATY
jgi:hypothetical protein